MNWKQLIGDSKNAIGEVSGLSGGEIEVFIYPEYFNKVRVGSIIIINSRDIKPIGIVLKLAHKSKFGSFTPLKMTRDDLKKAYPDLEKYYIYSSTIVYTSHLTQNYNVIHARAGMPNLHDLAFLVEDSNLLLQFFKPNNQWNFNFLKYYFENGAGVSEFRDFIYTHRDFFQKYTNEKETILESMINVLMSTNGAIIDRILEELNEIW